MKSALIADNDLGVNALLTEVVRLAGFNVQSVVDGQAALDRVLGGDIRLLVCDLDMPRLEGLEVIRGIASELRGREPQVLVVTGFLDDDVQEQLDRLPFVRTTFRKPFDLEVFQRTVEEIAQEHDGATTLPPSGQVDGLPGLFTGPDAQRRYRWGESSGA